MIGWSVLPSPEAQPTPRVHSSIHLVWYKPWVCAWNEVLHPRGNGQCMTVPVSDGCGNEILRMHVTMLCQFTSICGVVVSTDTIWNWIERMISPTPPRTSCDSSVPTDLFLWSRGHLEYGSQAPHARAREQEIRCATWVIPEFKPHWGKCMNTDASAWDGVCWFEVDPFFSCQCFGYMEISIADPVNVSEGNNSAALVGFPSRRAGILPPLLRNRTQGCVPSNWTIPQRHSPPWVQASKSHKQPCREFCSARSWTIQCELTTGVWSPKTDENISYNYLEIHNAYIIIWVTVKKQILWRKWHY